MGQKIWGMLTDYEGRWVAVDKGGRVLAHGATLPDVIKAVSDRPQRVTYLYAAAETINAES
ncbi:MAG: hypothetical protein KGJ84_04680 [Elusimicrobia bacterium]|nr:hypothetical protein [Elusimicrobiota bacterium]